MTNEPIKITFKTGGWVLVLMGLMLLSILTWALYPAITRTANISAGDGVTIESFKFNMSNLIIDQEVIVPGMHHRNMSPAISNPTILSTEELASKNNVFRNKFLVSKDLVVGVSINGESRIYPLHMLHIHEIINDTLGGIPIVVSWHWPSGHVAVHERGINQNFANSGLIANGTPYLKSRLFRHVVNYDLMVSTSDFWTKHLYKKYFLAKDVENYGYPRNDVLFRTPDHLDLIGVDVNKFKLLKMAKEKGHKIAIYSPTFRDDGSDAFSSGHLNIEKLNTFLSKHNIILVLKMHPLNARTYEDLSNIVNYDKDFDVYPVMSLSDMMITDYSSIYIDYLIIDRPIVFFNYDYEKYLEQNRKLQTKFLDTIPGVVTTEQEGLEKAILDHLISDNDTHKSDRTKLKEISYEFFDGDSAHRIFCKFEKWQK